MFDFGPLSSPPQWMGFVTSCRALVWREDLSPCSSARCSLCVTRVLLPLHLIAIKDSSESLPLPVMVLFSLSLLPASLMRAQVSLFKGWVNAWSDDLKSYLLLRLKVSKAILILHTNSFPPLSQCCRTSIKLSPRNMSTSLSLGKIVQNGWVLMNNWYELRLFGQDFFEPGVPPELDLSLDRSSTGSMDRVEVSLTADDRSSKQTNHKWQDANSIATVLRERGWTWRTTQLTTTFASLKRSVQLLRPPASMRWTRRRRRNEEAIRNNKCFELQPPHPWYAPFSLYASSWFLARSYIPVFQC